MPCVRKLARLAYLVFLPCVAQRRTPGSGRMETNVTTAASTKRNINVFLLGLAFMLMFTAFQTMGNVQGGNSIMIPLSHYGHFVRHPN